MPNQVGDQWQGADGNWYSNEGDAKLAHGGDAQGGSWGAMEGFGGTIAWFALLGVKIFIWLVKSGVLVSFIVSMGIAIAVNAGISFFTKTQLNIIGIPFGATLAASFVIGLIAYHKLIKVFFVMIALGVIGIAYIGMVQNRTIIVPRYMIPIKGKEYITAIVTANSTAMIGDPFGSISSNMIDLERGKTFRITGEAKGDWTPINYNRNEGWVRTADITIDTSDPVAARSLFKKGEAAYTKNKPEKAFALWSEAAELGSATAAYNLAECYFFGLGVTEDKAKAAQWYEKVVKDSRLIEEYIETAKERLAHIKQTK